MKLFFNMFRKQVINYVMEHLAKEETKAKWVDSINKSVDIPVLDESEEAVVYKRIIDKGFDEFKTLINNIK